MIRSPFIILTTVMITVHAADYWEHYRRGMWHYERWNADSTLRWLVPLYPEHKDNDTLALAIAEASLWKKDHKTATTILSALRNPQSPEALRVTAMLYEQAGRLQEALNLYEKAIPQLTKPWGAMERKALVLAWLKRIPEAKSETQKIIQSSQASVGLKIRCRIHHAEWTAWEKDLPGARQQLEQLLNEFPREIPAWLLLGQIQEWQGDFPGAKTSYGRVLALDSEHAEARLRLGRLQWVK